MPKVKKRPRVTSVRNTGSGRRAAAAKVGKKKLSAKNKVVGKKKKKKVALPPVVQMVVKQLDPQQKCGEQTSVQFLYRIDERTAGRSTFHLVFYDHHGWYCEHGRTCPAVMHARKFNGQLARA